MAVLVCIWSIRIGGAETFAVDLCRHLRSRGYDVFLFPVLSPWDEKYHEFIKASGVRVLSPFENRLVDWTCWKINALVSAFGYTGFRGFITRRFFKKVVEKHNVRFAISNSVIADNFVYASRRSKLHHIVVEHGEYSYAAVDGTPIDSTALLKASTTVCVSEWCQKILIEKFGLPSVVIYNGHADRETRPSGDSPASKGFTFCMVARGIQQKGWEEAIEAFLKVKRQNPAAFLMLVGEGDAITQLKERYKNTEGIVFTGRVMDPGAIIKDVHVGLVPSRKYEAFGIAILDFFAHGKPVLASNVGAIPEIVRYNGKAGGEVVPVDQNGKVETSALATQMLMMMQDQEKLSRASQDAREIYNSFSFEVTGKKYEELMTKIIAANG